MRFDGGGMCQGGRGALGGGGFRGYWYLETSKETSYREGRSWLGGLRCIGMTIANEGYTVHRCTGTLCTGALSGVSILIRAKNEKIKTRSRWGLRVGGVGGGMTGCYECIMTWINIQYQLSCSWIFCNFLRTNHIKLRACIYLIMEK